MNVLVLSCYILHVFLWRNGVYIQSQLQAFKVVKSERTQEKLTQQPSRGFHLSRILLRFVHLLLSLEKSTIPKCSSFWVDWPLLSVFPISGLLSPEAYFCLIYLTLLLNLYHHACLFSSPDFTLIERKWQQNFSWTWLPASMENVLSCCLPEPHL